MKWFDRWFYRKARWCWHRAGQEYPELKAEQDCLDDMGMQDEKRTCHSRDEDSALVDRDRDSGTGVNMDNSIRFSVLSCRGGLILEVRVYDRKTHENNTKTYLIPDGEPIAERIGQYVSMEMLTN